MSWLTPLGCLKISLIVVVIPLILGNLTRNGWSKKQDRKNFRKITPVFPAVSALGMYMIFFISMSTESVELIHHPQYLLDIGIPLSIFYILLFTVPLVYARMVHMSYADMVSMVYSVGGKNISIALALAVDSSVLKL
jgi:ACR3 family arsenite efflux pump ArsB